METQKIKVEGVHEEFEYETDEMNTLELALIQGHSKVASYLINDVQMKS